MGNRTVTATVVDLTMMTVTIIVMICKGEVSHSGKTKQMLPQSILSVGRQKAKFIIEAKGTTVEVIVVVRRKRCGCYHNQYCKSEKTGIAPLAFVLPMAPVADSVMATCQCLPNGTLSELILQIDSAEMCVTDLCQWPNGT